MQDGYKVILLINQEEVYHRDLLRGIGRYSRLYGNWALYIQSTRREPEFPPLKQLPAWGARGIIADYAGNLN
jgi:hypothetical protein